MLARIRGEVGEAVVLRVHVEGHEPHARLVLQFGRERRHPFGHHRARTAAAREDEIRNPRSSLEIARRRGTAALGDEREVRNAPELRQVCRVTATHERVDELVQAQHPEHNGGRETHEPERLHGAV
jgi:hypothetical protein